MTPRSLLHPARLARKPVLSSQSDERLVDLVRAGYEPAFETIVERYRRPLTHYVTGILPGERAEDAVQQSFVNAYEAIRRDDAELKLRPWLYRIAHNTALNGLRDRALAEQPLDERLDGVERPDQAFERRQGLARVIAAVQELPERQRDAIVLRELEGRSYEEISAALGVTGGAVRQLLNRARNALRKAATAATPVGLRTRIPWVVPAEPVGARVADLCGVGAAAGAGALAAKVCATAVVTGAVIGGAAVGPGGGDDGRHRGVDQAQAADRDSGPAGAAAPAGLATGAGGDSRRGASASGDDGRGGDGRGQEGDYGDDRGHDRGRGMTTGGAATAARATAPTTTAASVWKRSSNVTAAARPKGLAAPARATTMTAAARTAARAVGTTTSRPHPMRTGADRGNREAATGAWRAVDRACPAAGAAPGAARRPQAAASRARVAAAQARAAAARARAAAAQDRARVRTSSRTRPTNTGRGRLARSSVSRSRPCGRSARAPARPAPGRP